MRNKKAKNQTIKNLKLAISFYREAKDKQKRKFLYQFKTTVEQIKSCLCKYLFTEKQGKQEFYKRNQKNFRANISSKESKREQI